jgi:deazaflavin-dependent oxidoreductase (nitroreductase family)
VGTEIIALIEHVLDDRPGDWRVSIIGSIKLLFATGVAPPGYALLDMIGRKTGKPRRTPVGDGWVGYQFWLVVEHGMKAGYVRNIAANPRVRLKLRHGILARWHTGTAQVLPDDDARERQMWLAGRRAVVEQRSVSPSSPVRTEPVQVIKPSL